MGLIYRQREASIATTPAGALYIVTVITSIVALYVIWPIMGADYQSLEEYYIELGKIMRVWAGMVGVAFIFVMFNLAIRGLVTSTANALVLRLSFIERILVVIFLVNFFWGGMGLLMGWPLSLVAGDTYKGLLIPGIYWIVKKTVETIRQARSLTKWLLIGETLLLGVLVPTGHIPFSSGGRTFLTSVFFTLLFEEKSAMKRVVYGLLVAVGILTVLTTAAVRGVIISFVVVIVLNYLLRLREVRLRTYMFAAVFPVGLLFLTNQLLELDLGEYSDWTVKRFERSVSRERRFFGLDESLAQRVGETIDVGRAFGNNSPVFLLTGFGNGAMLHNLLITPSELNTYKTNRKHNIYVTAVAVMYRWGLLGILLYSGIAWYIFTVLRMVRIHRRTLASYREAVYLKVLVLYQLSGLIMSFVAYWYIGNIVVAFTLPLVEIFRRDLQTKLERSPSVLGKMDSKTRP